MSHLVGDQAIEQSRFDRSHRDVHGVTILEGLGGAHDWDGDDFGGYRPLQGMAQLGVPRLDGLERGLHFSSATPTGPVYDGDEHGGRTRGRQKNVCARSVNGREAEEPSGSQGHERTETAPAAPGGPGSVPRTNRTKGLSEISLLIRQSDFWCPDGCHE